MAIDPTLEAALAELAEKLEDFAGITPTAALKKDMELSTRIRRITAAVEAGALEAHTVNSHTDVTAASPNDGDFFRYDDTLNAWVADTASLIDLQDVNVPYIPLVDGDILKYSVAAGNVFINLPLELNSLNDVTVAPTGPTYPRYLTQYADGANWRAVPYTGTGFLFENGSTPLTASWDAQYAITVPTLVIDATIDHTITDSSDNLVITNPNANGDIVFNINKGGVGAWNFFKVDAGIPGLTLSNSSNTIIGGGGLIDVGGTWNGVPFAVVFNFQPTFSSNTIAFDIKPTLDTGGAATAKCFQYKPIIGTSTSLTSIALEDAITPIADKNLTAIGLLSEYTGLIPSGGTGAYTWNITGIDLDHDGHILNDSNATINMYGVRYRGGANLRIAGTLNQYGAKFEGYGTIPPAGCTIYAIHADGGYWAMASDSGKILMGASNDAEMYYNGSNFIIDPDAVGSGRVYIGATGDDDMLLNTIEIDGDINHDGSNVGLFGTSPTTQQTVTGSRGGNAALANLLTALANYGLIIDSTTA